MANCCHIRRHYSRRVITDISIVEGESIYGFNNNIRKKYLKFTLSNPRLIAAVRRALEQCTYHCDGVERTNLKCYEANIDFEIRFAHAPISFPSHRFMVDTSITGCCWIEVPMNSYQITPFAHAESRCQLEITCHYNDLIAHAPEGDWSDLAPFRILSYDIECAGRKGTRVIVLNHSWKFQASSPSHSTIRSSKSQA